MFHADCLIFWYTCEDFHMMISGVLLVNRCSCTQCLSMTRHTDDVVIFHIIIVFIAAVWFFECSCVSYVFGSILEVYPKDWSGWDNAEFANVYSTIYINTTIWFGPPHPSPLWLLCVEWSVKFITNLQVLLVLHCMKLYILRCLGNPITLSCWRRTLCRKGVLSH